MMTHETCEAMAEVCFRFRSGFTRSSIGIAPASYCKLSARPLWTTRDGLGARSEAS